MTTTQEKVGWGAAIAATLLILLVAMDQVMMPIATSAIAGEFSTDAGAVQAIISLVSLVAAPLYIAGGKLGDIHGKKKIFMAGLVLYGSGTLAATLAPNVTILMVGWSVVRALGMVLTIPASIGLLIANYPDEAQRGQAFAIYGVGGVTAALVGPLLMGISADALSWRLPFGLETVIAIGTIFLATRAMKETEPIEGAKVDWVGTAITFLAVASIILGSMLGGRYGWWLARRPFMLGETQVNPFGLSPAPLLMILGVIVFAILLARLNTIEEKGGQPLFSMKLFDNRTFFTASLMATVFFIITGALPFVVPVFLQQAIGFDGLQTALTMMSLSVGSIILGFASGSLVQRIQPRTLMQIFLMVVAIGMIWLFVIVSLNVTLGQLILPMFVIGCGFGVLSSQLPNIQMSTLTPELQGEGSGFAETGKELGIGLGTAVIGSIMFSMAIGGFVDNVARQADIPLTAEERAETILLIEDEAVPDRAINAIAQRVPNLEQVGKEAFVEGFQIALGVLVGVLLVSLLAASFIPKVEAEEVAAAAVKEAVADVSSKRL
ncbi:MAG: MFS transporter [Anaerolineae bacterium]|nr:MFS transporter [Anaerolineae bacterium]